MPFEISRPMREQQRVAGQQEEEEPALDEHHQQRAGQRVGVDQVLGVEPRRAECMHHAHQRRWPGRVRPTLAGWIRWRSGRVGWARGWGRGRTTSGYDPELLAEGDARNVVDRYRYWRVAAIVADLDTRRHPFHVAVENWQHDFNIGSVVRTANAFLAAQVHVVGRRRWNRRGAMVTDRYQHLCHHDDVADAGRLGARAGLPLVGVDNLPGAVPLEGYALPRACVLLFGQEGPGLSAAAHAGLRRRPVDRAVRLDPVDQRRRGRGDRHAHLGHPARRPLTDWGASLHSCVDTGCPGFTRNGAGCPRANRAGRGAGVGRGVGRGVARDWRGVRRLSGTRRGGGTGRRAPRSASTPGASGRRPGRTSTGDVPRAARRVASHQEVSSSSISCATAASIRAPSSRAPSPSRARSGSPNRTVTGGRPGTGQPRPRGIAANEPRIAIGTTGHVVLHRQERGAVPELAASSRPASGCPRGRRRRTSRPPAGRPASTTASPSAARSGRC